MSVEVWLVDTDVHAESYERILDARERARAAGSGTRTARRRYVAAHGAMRVLLGEGLGVDPAALAFRTGPYGKPILDGTHVNLSHSGRWAMIARSPDRPVGVDVQKVRPSLDAAAMSRRWFAPSEQTTGADVFARLWARKEAVIKAAGGRILRGCAVDVSRAVVDFPDDPAPGLYRVRDLPAPDGYRAAVAVAGPDAFDVTLRTYELRQITGQNSGSA